MHLASFTTVQIGKPPLCKELHMYNTKLTSPSVSEREVEQEADNAEGDPHCCQKIVAYHQPKLKRVNNFLWSTIWWYTICTCSIAIIFKLTSLKIVLVKLHVTFNRSVLLTLQCYSYNFSSYLEIQ